MSAAATNVRFDFDDEDLVDTCLMRVRREVCLDDDDVLPDIEVMLDDDEDFMDVHTSELIIECPSVLALPSPSVIAREAAVANSRRRRATTFRTKKKKRAEPSPRRWPVVLCGLVATYFAVTAFLHSPLGAKPEVKQVVAASRAKLHSLVAL